MRYTIWIYPWDLIDLSPEVVTEELTGSGLTAISMASSYHAGRFLQARSPARKAYFPEDGTVYFQPNDRLWDGHVIQPKVADLIANGPNVLKHLLALRDGGGLEVSCWTVCLHNTRLGMLHPQAVTRNALGDPNYYNLCPSNPDVRRYATTLIKDLSDNYRPNTIELESLGFMGFAHEYHHEKDAVGLLPEDDFLLSLCFCDACLERSQRAGVDGYAARQIVRTLIEDACDRAVPQARWPDFEVGKIDSFSDYPELHSYLVWRQEPVLTLLEEVRSAAHPDTDVHVIDLADGWRGGGALPDIASRCDGAIMCAYDSTEDSVHESAKAWRAQIGRDKYLSIGLRLYYPEMRREQDIVARARSAILAGANGLNFYNFGLIPAKRLAWIGAAIEAGNAMLPNSLGIKSKEHH